MAGEIIQNFGGSADFPPQRVSWEEKQKPSLTTLILKKKKLPKMTEKL